MLGKVNKSRKVPNVALALEDYLQVKDKELLRYIIRLVKTWNTRCYQANKIAARIHIVEQRVYIEAFRTFLRIFDTHTQTAHCIAKSDNIKVCFCVENPKTDLNCYSKALFSLFCRKKHLYNIHFFFFYRYINVKCLMSI